MAARQAHNLKVEGSNPSPATKNLSPVRLVVRTAGFHPANVDSISTRVTKGVISQTDKAVAGEIDWWDASGL